MPDGEAKKDVVDLSSLATPAILPTSVMWDGLATKPFRFTDLGKKSVEALTLEGLRELTTLRGMATGKPAPLGGGDGDSEDAWAERAAWCSKYLSLLSTFAARTSATARPSGGGIITLLSDFIDGGDVAKRLRFEWSSPAGGMPTTFWPLSGAPADAAMAAVALATALRGGAAASAARLAAEPGARGEGGDAFTSAAALARRAAGAWEAVRDAAEAADAGPQTRSAPDGPLPPGLALPGDRPAELVPATAAALARLCLADAQALAVARAEAKGLSPGALASLHAGAASLYDEAGAALAAASVDACVPLAGGLSASAALGAALSELRARKAAARDAFETGLDPGKAIAELRAASAALARGRSAVKAGGGAGGLTVADAAAATAALNAEAKAIETASAALDRERLVVYMTPVPSAPAPLPAGKVVVAPTPLVVEPVSTRHFS